MSEKLARDVMNEDVFTVPADLSVRELASVLLDREISGAPVVDEDGKLVGVVSFRDIALASSGGSSVDRDQSNPDFFVRGWEDRLEMSELASFQVEDEGLTVGEIMTPGVYAVDAGSPVSDVAETMLGGHLHRVLVTRDEKVVGIITTSDMLRLLAR